MNIVPAELRSYVALIIVRRAKENPHAKLRFKGTSVVNKGIGRHEITPGGQSYTMLELAEAILGGQDLGGEEFMNDVMDQFTKVILDRLWLEE